MIVVISGIALTTTSIIYRWSDEVFSSHATMTEIVAHQLQQYSEAVFNSLNIQPLLDKESLNDKDLIHIDSSLKLLSNVMLSEIIGLEGGFYLEPFDKFVGYAYPTLPPPKPAYGPPPRSHDIIKEQIKQTIEHNRTIVQNHKFDPAIFPLATVPIINGDKVIGATWVRIHIERKLPAYRLKEILNVIATVSISGFFVAVAIFLSLHRRTRNIRLGLERIQKDPSYRFLSEGGTYGFIADSINALVNNLDREHKNLQELENKLHQQDKLASLGKLIAGVAHEVKTPLAIIKTRVQLWQRRLTNSDEPADIIEVVTPETMELVVQEINRLTSLVNRLLVFSKPIATDLSEININDLIHQTIDLIKMDNSQIKFTEHYGEEISDLLIDPQAMKQVVLNIFTNSIQACGGNGTIRVSTSSTDSGKITLRISDSGPGMAEDILNKIYDPFFTTKEDGSGLGLSISYEIIKAHGGQIDFYNEPSGGLTCEIKLFRA